MANSGRLWVCGKNCQTAWKTPFVNSVNFRGQSLDSDRVLLFIPCVKNVGGLVLTKNILVTGITLIKCPVEPSTLGDRFWPKIASHFHVMGVRCGHIPAPGKQNLSVCFLQYRYSCPFSTILVKLSGICQ
jgi:hypothetical protein